MRYIIAFVGVALIATGLRPDVAPAASDGIVITETLPSVPTPVPASKTRTPCGCEQPCKCLGGECCGPACPTSPAPKPPKQDAPKQEAKPAPVYSEPLQTPVRQTQSPRYEWRTYTTRGRFGRTSTYQRYELVDGEAAAPVYRGSMCGPGGCR